MQYKRLGLSGLKVSSVALGAMGLGSPSWRSWVLDSKASIPVVEKALELGINIIDTCDFYSSGESERVVGKILKDMGVRDQVMIATKVGNPMGRGVNNAGYSRKHIVEAVDASLRRLGTDRIDLYQTHIWDPDTNIEEMVDTFDMLVKQGKILYVGATDIPCWQLAKAVYYARASGQVAFSTLQHHYNAVWREDERDLIPFCRAEGLGMFPYSPVARGFLAGQQRRSEKTTERAKTDNYAWTWYGRPADEAVALAIEAVATRLSVEPAQVALRWVMQSVPESIPVIGPTTVQHVQAAIEATELTFDRQLWDEIDKHYEPRKSGGHF